MRLRYSTSFDSSDAEGTEEIRALYRQVRYGSAQGSTAATANAPVVQKKKNTAAVLTKKVGQNLPSWRDVMQIRRISYQPANNIA